MIAFDRQLAALKKVAASEKKRFPLWDLLPLSGVGGDILDSWAARMRDAVRGGPAPQALLKEVYGISRIRSIDRKKEDSLLSLHMKHAYVT